MHITVITQDSSLRCKLCTCIDFSGNVVTYIEKATASELSTIFELNDTLLIVDMAIENAVEVIKAAIARNWNGGVLPMVSLRNNAHIIKQIDDLGLHRLCFFPVSDIEMKTKLKRAIAEIRTRVETCPASDG